MLSLSKVLNLNSFFTIFFYTSSLIFMKSNLIYAPIIYTKKILITSIKNYCIALFKQRISLKLRLFNKYNSSYNFSNLNTLNLYNINYLVNFTFAILNPIETTIRLKNFYSNKLNTQHSIST